MTELALLFGVVFVLNVVPAFVPPTWMAMSAWGFASPDIDHWLAAVVAAAAATCGRIVLALAAQRLVGSRWVHAATRQNLATVADLIQRRKAASVSAFLVFAFSPLPSNVLFLAYGMTKAPLGWLAVPFFIGRFGSYALALEGGSAISTHLEAQVGGQGVWVWVYFAVTQLALVGLVWLFAKIDWRASLAARRLRWERAGRDESRGAF